MALTNCVNCGATIHKQSATCPFCGTEYLDLNPSALSVGKKFALRYNDEIFTAYVSECDVRLTAMCASRDVNGRLRLSTPGKNIRFTIIASMPEYISSVD